MPTYLVQAPDGRKLKVEAPEGATEQDAISYAQQNMPPLEAKGQNIFGRMESAAYGGTEAVLGGLTQLAGETFGTPESAVSKYGAGLVKRGSGLVSEASQGAGPVEQLAVDVASSVPSSVAGLGVAALTKSPAAGMAVAGLSAAGSRYGGLRAEGFDSETAAPAAAVAGIVEAITEKLPIDSLLSTMKGPLLNRILKRAGAEGLQEMLAQSVEEAYNAGILDKDTTIVDALKTIGYAGLVGTIAASPITATVSTLEVSKEKKVEQAKQAAAKTAEAKRLRGLKPPKPVAELDPQELIDSEAKARLAVEEHRIEAERRAKSESLAAGLREPTEAPRKPLALEDKRGIATPPQQPSGYPGEVLQASEVSPTGAVRTPEEVSLENRGMTQYEEDGNLFQTKPAAIPAEPTVDKTTRVFLDDKERTILTGPKAGQIAATVVGAKQLPNRPGFFVIPKDKTDEVRNLLDPNLPVDTEVKPLTRTKDEPSTPELGEKLDELSQTYQEEPLTKADTEVEETGQKDYEVVASLERTLGRPAVDNMLRRKRMVIASDYDTLPEGYRPGEANDMKAKRAVAFYHKGKVYFIANRMKKDDKDILGTAIHEIGEHQGLQPFIDDGNSGAYEKLLQDVEINKFTDKDIKKVWDDLALSKEYGPYLEGKMDQRPLKEQRKTFIKEVIANLAQTYPNSPFYKRLAGKIKASLYRLTGNRSLLSDSAIRELVVRAMRKEISKEYNTTKAETTAQKITGEPPMPAAAIRDYTDHYGGSLPRREDEVKDDVTDEETEPADTAPRMTERQVRDAYTEAKKTQLAEKDPKKLRDTEQEIQSLEDLAAMRGIDLARPESIDEPPLASAKLPPTLEEIDATVTPELVGQGYGYIRKILRSSADVMKKTKGLEKLGEAVVDLVDNAQKNRGLFNEQLNVGMKALESLPRKDRLEAEEQFQKLITARQEGDTTTVEEIYSNAKPELRQLVDAVDEAFRAAGSLMEKLEIMVHNPISGKYHKFRRLENFFPNIMKAEYREALIRPTDSNGNPTAKFQELAQHLIDANQKYSDEDGNEHIIESVEDALRYVKVASEHSNFESGFFGNIERARTLPFPPSVYDYSLASVHKYRERWAERIAQIESFGQEVRLSKDKGGSKDLFQQTLDNILGKGDPRVAQVEQLRNIIYGDRQHYNMIQKAMQASSTLATGLQISGPMSVLKNFLGGVTNASQFLDVDSFVKSLSEIMDSDSRAAAFEVGHNLGIISDDFLRSISDMEVMGLSQKEGWARVQKTVSALTAEAMSMRRLGPLKHFSFNSSEAFVRVLSSIGAKHQLTKWVSAYEANPSSRSSKVFKRFAKDEGIDIEKMMKEDGFNNLGESPQTARFVRRYVNRMQGSYRQDQVPAFLDSDLGKFFFKYTKYGWQLGRMFDKTVVENIQSGDPDLVKEGVQNFVKFLGVYSSMGYLTSAAIKAIFGSDLMPDWKEIWETLKDKDEEELKQVAYAMGLMGSSMQIMGAFGPLSIAWNKYSQWMDYGDSPLSAPGLSVFINIGTQLAKYIRGSGDLSIGIDESDSTTDALKFLTDQVSLMRQPIQALSEQTGKPGLIARKRTVTKAREIIRRFAKSTGLVELKGGASARIPSKYNILNDRINNALLMGDGDKAAEIYAQAEGRAKLHKDLDTLKSEIGTSISNRRPMAVQGTPGGKVGVELFDEWAQTHLSTEDYNRIKKLDDEYMEAAQESGLIKPIKQKEINKAMRDYERGQEPVN